MTHEMASGVPQADGQLRAEPRMQAGPSGRCVHACRGWCHVYGGGRAGGRAEGRVGRLAGSLSCGGGGKVGRGDGGEALWHN